MEVLIAFALLLLLFLVFVSLVGHGLWLFFAWLIKELRGEELSPADLSTATRCAKCNSRVPVGASRCVICGWEKPSTITTELLNDLAATDRQLKRFRDTGQLDDATYQNLKLQIDAQRSDLTSEPSRGPSLATEPGETDREAPARPAVVAGSFIATDDEIVIEPVPTFLAQDEAPAEFAPQLTSETRQPRRSFAEVLNSFMEESNIRWGEIVGGLLIIGCSTALVVSLWSQISQIPVLKFLIFTTVTAALFGVGLYTEHRWKLPTTSRGILTIATLLVPLNFLAIAAVSSGLDSGGAAIVASELIAPAVFLCLVYFAGKVLTPAWPHLLVAGVLGSSVGQLLIRHFASADASPLLLVALGAFPLGCYVAASIWMLRKALFDSKALESTPIFITLGALTFAAVLPFSLLLFKAGPVAMSMMYLAPLVSVGGFPMLAVGLPLWRKFTAKQLVTTRTIGTALSILGTAIVVAGMILAWPNPASIVPAALFNFAVFTALAVVLDLPFAHLLGAICLGQAYLVLFHVTAGNVAWLNLRETSLLSASLSVSSGLALAPLFIALVIAAEWLARIRNDQEGQAYTFAASLVAVASLSLTTAYGIWFWRGPFALWFAYATCAFGAFWIGWRRQWLPFCWAGSVLLLVSFAQAFALLGVQFPWQTAVFTHATVCAIASLVLRNRIPLAVLRGSALISSFAAVATLVQAAWWETTGLQAQRLFWLAGIWLALVWLTQKTFLFTLFQLALTIAIVLAIKATLQQYAWYAYLPHAFLHPWSLQIQGTALTLLSMVWLALRHWSSSTSFPSTFQFADDVRRLLNARWSFDRIVLWGILIGFVGLSVYGALPGVTRELTAAAESNPSWNIAGFPHEQALGLGSWLLLALLLLTFLGTVWQRRRSLYLPGALTALACLCPLIAGTSEPLTATASAWRWCAAIFLVVTSLPLWFRSQLAPQLRSLGWPAIETNGTDITQRVRELLLIVTVVPILLLTAYPAIRAVYYMPVHGPSAGFFAQLDPRLSHSLPLVLLSLAIIGHGLRERLPAYIFFAGCLFNAATTIAYLLSVVSTGSSMDRVVAAHGMQLNAIVFALYALVWLAARQYWSSALRSAELSFARRLLSAQVVMAVVTNVLLVLPTTVVLSTRPEFLSIGAGALSSAPGWMALLLAIVAALAFAAVYGSEVKGGALFLSLLTLCCLFACSFATATEQNWEPAHAYVAGVTISAGILLLSRWLPRKLSFQWLIFSNNWERECLRFAAITGVFAGFLSLRLSGDDPSTDWWSITPLLALSLLFGALNWFTLRRRFIYLAGFSFTSAAFIWAAVHFPQPFPLFVGIHITALALSSIVWLVLELRARRLSGQQRSLTLSFHNVVAVWALSVVTLLVLGRLILRADGVNLIGPAAVDWISVVSLAPLLFACLWDKHAKYAVAAIYVTGLLLLAQLLDELSLSWTWLGWAATLVLAAYTVFTSALWTKRQRVIELASQIRIPTRLDPATTQLPWLVVFNVLLVSSVVILAYVMDLTYAEFPLRLTGAIAVVCQSVAFAFMAEGESRSKWQRAAIAMLVGGIVFVGWAGLTPGVTGTWFNRAVITMVELFALVGVYAAIVGKASERLSDWASPVQKTIPWIAGSAVVALLFSLATEIFYQVEFGAVNIAPLALFAIAATLIAGILIPLLFALSSKHDPLRLSERGRMNYVYAAEVMLALLFLHVRLSLPWLFSGFFERYWPLVVMAVAYLGVAISESLRRRKLLVLARPIERTGAFLPLLPVLGFWLAYSEVDYSAVLFVVGGLYGLLSLLRRSFLFGLLAAVAGNGGLWYMWHRSADFQFLQHPQLWLIPVAVSVLIAAYVNEEGFSEEQMAGIRYLSLVTIYASSTADIFINGVADSPWLPLILAAFSLAGVFFGIVFRIRGFLLLGSVFLLLSIVTMIWYASANLGWTWLWYVAGIVTGATIIFMFAVFEKKRSEVLRVVEGFKDWER